MIIMGGDHVFLFPQVCVCVCERASDEISFVEICQILWTSASRFFPFFHVCICCYYLLSMKMNSALPRKWLYEVIKFLSFFHSFIWKKIQVNIFACYDCKQQTQIHLDYEDNKDGSWASISMLFFIFGAEFCRLNYIVFIRWNLSVYLNGNSRWYTFNIY